MEYSIINPPCPPIGSKTRQQAQEFFRWFVASIPERVAILQVAIASSAQEAFSLDYSLASFDGLERWLKITIETRYRTLDEYQHLLNLYEVSAIPGLEDITPPKTVLTYRSTSLLVDVAMYWSNALKLRFPQLEWTLQLKPRNLITYHDPVLKGFYKNGMGTVSPIQIMDVVFHRMLEPYPSPSLLKDVFETWSYIVPA